jgi:Domain of unknown function (DUF4198)
MCKPISRLIIILIICVTLRSGWANAENVWLLPSSSFTEYPDVVSIDVGASSLPFMMKERSLPNQRLRVLGPDGEYVEVKNLKRLAKRCVFDVSLRRPGTYRVSISGREILAKWQGKNGIAWIKGETEDILRNVPLSGVGTTVEERWVRYETFVIVGEPSPIASEGRGLELDLVENFRSVVGVEARSTRFVLLMDGAPAPGVQVSIVRGRYQRDPQPDLAYNFITLSDGSFLVTWSEPGFYLLQAQVVSRNSGDSSAQRRLIYAATLEVLPSKLQPFKIMEN